MLTLICPSGTPGMRVDTRSTKGPIVFTTLMVLAGLAMEQEPLLLCGTLSGITPFRGKLVMGLTKHNVRWRVLDNLIIWRGNFILPSTCRLT
jgi:hypothetical protein